jgi:hypothetical protein
MRGFGRFAAAAHPSYPLRVATLTSFALLPVIVIPADVRPGNDGASRAGPRKPSFIVTTPNPRQKTTARTAICYTITTAITRRRYTP